MAIKIKKIKEAGVLIYPATVLDAVKDATAKITVDGSEVANPTYGKTVREIIEDNEKVTSTALNELDTRVGALKDLTTTEKSNVVKAINEVAANASGAVGDMTTLTTDKKDTVVNAINELDAAIDKLNGANTADGSVAKAVKDAVEALDVASTDANASATGTNVTVGISETDGKVKVESVSESYATITAVARVTDEDGIETTAPSYTVTSGDESKLVKASDLANLKTYADDAIAKVNSTAVNAVSKSDISTAIPSTSAASVDTKVASEKAVRDAVDAAKKEILTGGADATIDSAYDTLKEVADWIASNDSADDAAGLTKDVSTLKTTVGDSTSGLVKKVADLEAVGATKTEASTTNGNIKIDGTETTVYTHHTQTAATAAAVKVGNDSEGHVVIGDALTAGDIAATAIAAGDDTVAVAGTDVATQIANLGKAVKVAASSAAVEDTTAGDGKIKIGGVEYTVYTEVANTVHDANYAHITVTSTSVSDGTNTMTLPTLSVKSGSENYVGVSDHEVEIKTSSIAASTTGLATSVDVYNYAVTAEDATDTTDYADVF